MSDPLAALPPGRSSLRLICASYPPVLGGTEIEAQRVCAALRQRGHAIRVLSVGGGPMPAQKDWTDPLGVPVRLYGAWCPPRWRQYVYALGVAWTLFRERRRYRIAYFLMGGVQLAIAVPVAAWLRKPILMKFSGSNTIAPLAASRLGRLELRQLRKHADRVLVLNPAMMQEAREAGFDTAQLGWMPNPVDIDVFAPAAAARRLELRAQKGLPPQAQVALFVGRLAPEKELPSLLEGFALAAGDRPDLHLVLVGDGPLRRDLESLADRLALPARIHFAGAVPADAVTGWLQAADLFALVSSLEGFPCALIEAMAAGLPAVVSDIAANRQLIEDGVHGQRVPCRDARAIAAALLRLAGDPARRAAMAAACRQRVVDHYATGKVVERYEILFNEITAAPEQKRRARHAQPRSLAGG